MASLVSGFEYDIFISYRQKDNRGDHWVTDFVNALKSELDATFKEDISIYFDENPHDGLLDTHDVDESLREKLKCLVFIPIISQTYCDPKSFAWKNEFLAFKILASEDQFGLKIRLQNGNVASRILPVRIHELGDDDKSFLELEIGPTRAIDFIYKEPGVNRSLRIADSKAENLNKTDYRNQINRVSHAIKDLISSLTKPASHIDSAKPGPSPVNSFNKRFKRMLVGGVAIVMSLAAYVAFFVHANLNASTSSIAVIPFRNNTGDQSKDVYGIGIASEVITKLSLTKQFNFVSALQSTIKFQQTNDSPIEIGKDLGVTHLLSGVYQTAGNDIQVTAELIEAATGKVLWSLPYRTHYNDILEFESNIASQVLHKFSLSYSAVSGTHVPNIDAYYHYMRGREVQLKRGGSLAGPLVMSEAIPHYLKAIELDSAFLAPFKAAIGAYGFLYVSRPEDTLVSERTVRPLITYVAKHFPDNWEKKDIEADYSYFFMKDLDRAWKLSEEAISENPEDVSAYSTLATISKRKLKLQESLVYHQKWAAMSPLTPGSWANVAVVFRLLGDRKNEEKASRKLYELNGPTSYLFEMKREQNLEDLPKNIKDEFGKIFAAELLFQKRKLSELITYADTVKIDSSFKKAHKFKYKAFAYYLQGNDREAHQNAAALIDIYKPGPSKALYEDFFIMNLLTGNEEKSMQLMDKALSHRDQTTDLIARSERIQWEITFYALSNKYQAANLMLERLNREFPQLGYYAWLNIAYFDRIKKEYPAFQKTISNLKLPPLVSIPEGAFKW